MHRKSNETLRGERAAERAEIAVEHAAPLATFPVPTLAVCDVLERAGVLGAACAWRLGAFVALADGSVRWPSAELAEQVAAGLARGVPSFPIAVPHDAPAAPRGKPVRVFLRPLATRRAANRILEHCLDAGALLIEEAGRRDFHAEANCVLVRAVDTDHRPWAGWLSLDDVEVEDFVTGEPVA